MGDGLTGGGDESRGLEEQAEGRRRALEVAAFDDPRELCEPLREVGDPGSGGEVAALVALPRRRDCPLRKVREETADFVRLLELAVANLDEFGEVAPDRGEELAAEGGLALEESVEGVLDAVVSDLEGRDRLKTEL